MSVGLNASEPEHECVYVSAGYEHAPVPRMCARMDTSEFECG